MKTDLAMAIHFHQPVGNFDYVIERAFDKCYMPFLQTLKKYPDIKMTFHFTGCLLEWAEEKRPELFPTIASMVKNGQVEIMAGGFYEPILPSIPRRDRLAQIAMLQDYVKTKFSCEPKGAWVAERVWEPGLPSVLHDSGVKYVILDDTHFLYSGVPKERTYGHYITEDEGKGVAVFPSDKVLRYYIPYKMPEECINYMRGVFELNKDATFIYGDDGEKFGEWPGTHKWVFEEKWLEKFFDQIQNNSDWINTVTLSECLEKKPPLGRVYLPTSSYEEMLEWALPADSQEWLEDVMKDLKESGKEEFYKPFIRGGFWRNFFEKYPESNHMNKKMVYISNKLESLKDAKNIKQSDLNEAQKELFRGQCNCAYWHGVFGGLYLFHLRRAIYHHLIKSETVMDVARFGRKPFCEASVLDLDADGHDDVILENRDISLYLDPAEGGVLKEFDSKTVAQNLMNSLARRKEAYHRKIWKKLAQQSAGGNTGDVQTIHDDIQVADPELKDHLTYDWYGRHGLIDHFLGKETDINAFSKCDYHEAGDFVKGVYDFEVKRLLNSVSVIMKREGRVDSSRVDLIKEVTLPKKGSSFKVDYRIVNREDVPLDLVFAPEINLTMPDGNSERYIFVMNGEMTPYNLDDVVHREDVDEVEIRDKEDVLSWKMQVTEKCHLWHFPVKTVSQSEKAYELNYQSSAVVPVLDVKIEPGEEKSLTIHIELT
ncbi:MAG: alpha-amylase/4-alpha-glucanotransferase domain-containing protein [Candidatus Omnitrophota bacterium]